MQASTRTNISKRRFYLLYGILVMLFLGLIYAWSVFIAPLETTFGWVRSETSLIFTISLSSFCVGGIIAGFLIKKTSYRKTLYLSSILVLAGFIGATRIHSLMGIYFTYGVLCGTGVGLGYNATLGMLAQWYRDKPGFCSGALMMGFGFGSLLLGTSATYLMNFIGWQGTFVLFGVISSILVFLSAHIIKEKPPALDHPAFTKKSSTSGPEVVNMDHKQMIKQPSFWLFYFWAMFMVAAGLSVIGNAVPIAQEIGMPIALATTMSGLISVTNGGSRILFGSAFDWFGKDKTILIDSLIALIAMSLLVIALSISSIPFMIASFVLTGLAYGGAPPLTSSFTNHMYGTKNYPFNFSIINTLIIPATFLGPALTGIIQANTGSYLNAFYFLLPLCLLGGILGLLVKGK